MIYEKIKTSHGFSLIEVLISLVLFVALSISMMDVLNQTTRSEKQMEKLIQANRIIQNVTYAVKKDLQTMTYIPTTYIANLSYEHYFLNLRGQYQADYYEDYFPENNKPFIRNESFPKMGFTGDENSFYFTSPLSTDSRFSTVRVAYVIEPCPDQGRLQCLMRKTAPHSQTLSSERNSEFEKKQVLVENVKKFQVEYFNQGEWISEFKEPIRKGLIFPLPPPSALRLIIKMEKNNIDFYIPLHSTLLSNKITAPKTFVAIPDQTRPDSSANQSDSQTGEPQ